MALTKLNFGGKQQALVAANIPTITSSSMPAGTIIKTETKPFTNFGDIDLNNTANDTDIPGTEQSFTRTIANSKILVQYNFKCTSYLLAYLNLQRKIGSGSYATVSTGATGTQNGRTSSKQILGQYYNYSGSVNAMGYGIHADFYQFIDSTSTGLTDTTDAITYKITAYSDNASGRKLNANIDGYSSAHSSYHNTSESSVTFYEVKV